MKMLIGEVVELDAKYGDRGLGPRFTAQVKNLVIGAVEPLRITGVAELDCVATYPPCRAKKAYVPKLESTRFAVQRKTFYARLMMTPEAYPLDASLPARRRKHIAEMRQLLRAAWDVLATKLSSEDAKRRLEESWAAIEAALNGAEVESDDR